jgi:hypothetical protein
MNNHKLESLREIPGRTNNCYKCKKPAIYIYNKGRRDCKQLCLPHASECAEKYGIKLGKEDEQA